MRNMSVSHTAQQCVSFQKTVTRRNGWWDLKAGDLVQLIEKGQGLKKGEKVVKIHPALILSARGEPLDTLLKLPAYAEKEMIREGFPEKTPQEFVKMYCELNHCTPETKVNRIEFRYYMDATKTSPTITIPVGVAVCPSCRTQLTVSPDGWTQEEDKTWICDSFTLWCASEPDMEDEDAYAVFEAIHEPELYVPYLYWIPIENKIESWMKKTFRFNLYEE